MATVGSAAGRRWVAGSARKLGLAPVPLAVAGVVALLVVPVVLVVLLASLRPGAALPFDAAPLTLDNFVDLLADPFTYRLLLNTVLYAAVSLAIGMVLAVPLVWLVERTDLPAKVLIASAMYVPLVVPGALKAMGWALLLAPRQGFANVWLRDLLGMETAGPGATGPLDFYSFAGLVLITGTGIAPSMFIMLSAAFRNMDSQLEEAGRASGATTASVVQQVTLPLMAPSLVAASIYYTILLFETFEVPLVIGPNANFQVLSTHVFQLVQGEATRPQYGQAAVFGTFAILIGVGLAALYARVSRDAYRYAVLRGQRQAPRLVRLGRWKWAALGTVALYLLLTDVLPVLALLWASLFRTFTPPSLAALSGASLEVYRLVLADPRWGRALANTVILVVAASLATVVLATLVSWVVLRTRVGWLRWLDALAFLPRAIPGVILALGVFLLLIRTPLYATIWIIVVGHTLAFLPYAVRLMNATLLQVHQELEEAARASGAGVGTTLAAIVFPLLRPALLNCALWIGAHSIRDFTYPLILGTAANTVVAQLLWQSWSRGQWERTAAMAVMLLVALTVLVVPARYLLGRREAV
jgi:iron(III) transport system permease protein